MAWVRCFGLVVLLSLVGCSTVNHHFDPSKPHHRPDGFANNHIAQVNKSLRDLLVWFYEQKRDGLPKPPSAVYASYEAFPVVQPDLRYLAQNRSDNTVTWIGHAISLVQSRVMNIMVDPVFSERASMSWSSRTTTLITWTGIRSNNSTGMQAGHRSFWCPWGLRLG